MSELLRNVKTSGHENSLLSCFNVQAKGWSLGHNLRACNAATLIKLISRWEQYVGGSQPGNPMTAPLDYRKENKHINEVK